MDEVLDIAQADALRSELYACYRRVQREHQETWKRYASKFPELRVRLANLVRPARKNIQNAFDMARAVREYGAVVAAETGVSVGTQVLQQLRLYKKYRVPADCYYFLGMYEKPIRKKARFFLGDKVTSLVLHYLATTAPEDEFAPLHEKIAFWEHCREHEFSAVPVLAVFRGGSLQQDYSGIRDTLPSRDLFSKPVTAFLGQGARKWAYDATGHFRDDAGRTYTSRAVVDALKEQSKEKALLLQPCVYDHPQLQELTGRVGPSTLRIVTIRPPNGVPEYFAGFLTTPFKDVPAPTFKERTALAARVDAESGRLRPLLYKHAAYLQEGRERHPVTGKQMAGFELPGWDEAKALALEAHATLPSIACVGWDMVLTESGPLFLEGNYDCSAALTQITHQRLLGLTHLPACLSTFLQMQDSQVS